MGGGRRRVPKANPERRERQRTAAAAARFEAGRQAGYEQGIKAGHDDFDQPFDGTSIIIPSYNQREVLLQCLENLEAHTQQPYELIVVDDASSDGTAEAISKRRRVRLAVHEQNKGFAGAVNTGLMMAKGRNVLLLNNDVLVAENWLLNMLNCLHSSPDIGAVGPVTNYIGGEQQIGVPYAPGDMAGMLSFAAANNKGNPDSWRQTDRLVGFCLLMKRETVQATGYFDEGFKVGNFEDDDWNIRLRLQGLKLMIAGDAFVHHMGSVTMKSLDNRQFAEINNSNGDFFRRKWGNIHERLQQLQLQSGSGTAMRGPTGWGSGATLPSGVLAESSSGRLYWIENGARYRIGADPGFAAALGLPAVRLSQWDLKALPLGGEWTPEAARAAAAGALSPTAGLEEGTVAELPDGRMYQIFGGKAHLVLSRYAAEVWGLAVRSRRTEQAELDRYPEGNPVLPPAALVSALL